jgi:heme/copper-type cytochrome/quinol oxidase subunit 1
MALTALGFVMLVLQTKRVDADDEDAVDDDPWGGQTVEWLTTSPAPAGNFAEVPVVTSTEPMLDLAPVGAAAGEGDR